jgi:hypothetical protein
VQCWIKLTPAQQLGFVAMRQFTTGGGCQQLRDLQLCCCCRWEQEQQLYCTVLRPLLKWQQQQPGADGSSMASPVSPLKHYKSSSCSGSLLSSETLLAAAAAVEQLLLRDIDRQAAADQARQEMQAEAKQLQAQAAQLQEDLQVRRKPAATYLARCVSWMSCCCWFDFLCSCACRRQLLTGRLPARGGNC